MKNILKIIINHISSNKKEQAFKKRKKEEVVLNNIINSYINETVQLNGDNYIGYNCKINNCSIGKMSYIANNANISHISIGKFTSIGPGCQTLYGDHPTKEFVTTHPAFYSKNRPSGRCFVTENKFEEFRFVDRKNNFMVSVGNDVWIASNVSILGGITIGDGAIIAAGAVVTKDVPPYAIVGGVPAKLIRYRFDNEDIQWLLNLKWWDKDEEWIKKFADAFENIDQLKEQIKK